MRACLVFFLLFCLAGSPALAQVRVQHNAIPNAEIFGLEMGNGQTFYGRVRAVNSVSVQNYRTAAFTVTEMVIDMANSPIQLRIYSAEPVDAVGDASSSATVATSGVPFSGSAISSASTVAGRISEPIRSRARTTTATLPVVKDYPLTTHAKTIEYKLATAGHVRALFDEFSDHWLAMPEAVDAARTADAESNETRRISPLSRAVFRVE